MTSCMDFVFGFRCLQYTLFFDFFHLFLSEKTQDRRYYLPPGPLCFTHEGDE